MKTTILAKYYGVLTTADPPSPTWPRLLSGGVWGWSLVVVISSYYPFLLCNHRVCVCEREREREREREIFALL